MPASIRIFIIIYLIFGYLALNAQNLTDPEKTESEYVLFDDMTTPYSIAIPESASSSEFWAARELQHWLAKVSQAYFSVVEYADKNFGQLTEGGPYIFVGYSPSMTDSMSISPPKSNDESFYYFNEGPNLFILGGSQRGTMYGVVSFLEKELDCRWFTPVVNQIPEKQEYRFSKLSHQESPGVAVRNDFYFEAFDPVWAARNKMNGRLSFGKKRPVNQPGGVESYWAVHTFYPLMPPEEFFNDHPEYYSLVDGKRIADQEKSWSIRGQLCLSNPEVLNIMTERIRNVMRENPDHLIYSVSQNDWRNPCQCDPCQNLVKQFGGKESGIVIWFVNKIAEAIEDEFPDKYIGTLAYQYTRSAPENIRPRNNVVVRLCPIEACVAHPLDSCPQNAVFMNDLTDWSNIAPHLYIWDYVVNFARYIMPYPNFQVLKPNIRSFIDNNAIGIMEQADYQGRGGEFSEIKAYLISKLLWNPDSNVDDIIDEFMVGYYGGAAGYIRQYFDLLQDRIGPETHMHIGLKPDNPIFTDELVKKSMDLMDQAIKAVPDKEIRRRVERTSLSILYLRCKRDPIAARNEGTFRRFIDIAEKDNITVLAEYGETMDSFKEFVLNAK